MLLDKPTPHFLINKTKVEMNYFIKLHERCFKINIYECLQ